MLYDGRTRHSKGGTIIGLTLKCIYLLGSLDVARPWRFHVFFVTQGNRCNALELFICSKGHPPLPSPALAGSHDIKSVVYCGEIGDKIMSPDHLQLVLFIFTNFSCPCGEAGKEFSSIVQNNSSLPRSGRADALLNGSVLLVLGGAPSVLLDRQRESQVNVVVY